MYSEFIVRKTTQMQFSKKRRMYDLIRTHSYGYDPHLSSMPLLIFYLIKKMHFVINLAKLDSLS